MRIAADRDTCIGSGQCVLADPDVFDQDDDDGLVILLDEGSSTAPSAGTRLAVQGCPAGALRLVPGSTP